MTKCRRCGLSIRNPVSICPSCGANLGASDDGTAEKDYYALFELSPHLSHTEIVDSLRKASRFWTQRANNAPRIEQRHKAELMLQCLAEAEAILLNPARRRAYDKAIREQQKTASHNYSSPASSETGSRRHVSPTKCPRCGVHQSVVLPFCPACGFDLSATVVAEGSEEAGQARTDQRRSSGSQEVIPPLPFPTPEKTSHGESADSEKSYDIPMFASSGDAERWHSTLLASLGLRRSIVVGTVIAVEPIYTAVARTNWSRLLFKMILGIALIPVIFGLVIGAAMMWVFFSILRFGSRGGSGFFSRLASQVIGFFLSRKLFGPKEQIPVRDFRLRDSSGYEYLIRMQGDLVAGNISVGDEVKVEGFDRRGTLMFHRGWNKRTRSEIKVRIR